MLTTEAVGLAINIATGIIKLAGRVDVILAEREAVQAPVALPQPPVGLGPTQPEMVAALKKLLKAEKEDPDPLAKDRAAIEKLVARDEPEPSELAIFMKRYLPEQALGTVLDLDSQFIQELRQARPGFPVDQKDVRVAAFYLAAGKTDEGRGYAWRIALTVVDVFAEFGAENAALFTRNPRLQSIVGSVLKRFGEADLQTADSWSEVLKRALSATLNGAVDARGSFDAGAPWLETVLNALADARDAVPEKDRTNYLLGLLQGEGYPRLVATLLESASQKVAEKHSSAFGKVAADLLKTGSDLLDDAPDFEDFFKNHWSDLLQAGFKSLETHGPSILQTKSPVLNAVLQATVQELAATPARDLLSQETLLALVDTAVKTAASQPDEFLDKLEDGWTRDLVQSVVGVLGDKGIAGTFSTAGLESVVREALASMADHPELLAGRSTLLQDVVGSILTSVGKAGTFAVADVGLAAARGALEAVARNPDLLPKDIGGFVAAVAGKAAALVDQNSLTKLQGTDLVKLVLEAVQENPPLFLEGKTDVVDVAIDAILEVASGKGSLLSGAVVTGVLSEVLGAFARGGQRKVEGPDVSSALLAELSALLEAGAARAASELGHRLSLGTLPEVLGLLVSEWLRGGVAVVDADDPAFKRLLSDLADRVAA